MMLVNTVAEEQSYCKNCGQRQYLVTTSRICGNCAMRYERKAQEFLEDGS